MSSTLMAYIFNNQVTRLQPGELAFYHHDKDFILADPNACLRYHNNPSYLPCIHRIDSDDYRDLDVGTVFEQMPEVKMQGYCSPLLPGEQAVFHIEGMWHGISTKAMLDWVQQAEVCVGVRREGRVDKLPPGSWFYVEKPVTNPIPDICQPSAVLNPLETSCDQLLTSSNQQPAVTDSIEVTSKELPVSSSETPADLLPVSTVTPLKPESEFSSKSFPRYPEENKQPAFPASQSVPHPRPQDVPTCVTCKTKAEEGFRVFSLWCCLGCLLEQFEKQRLSSPSRSGKCDWNAELIYELWTMLQERRPEESRAKLPQTCPLPLDSVICEGKHIEIKPNYPATGHIVGSGSLCPEGGCPDHPLCRGCANILCECPRCSHIITFEEVPDGCPSDCAGSVQQTATFDIPCSSCGQKWQRQKDASRQLR